MSDLKIGTTCIPWDDLINVFRDAAPKPGMYGLGDRGGNTPMLLRMLSNPELVEQVAKEILAITHLYEKETSAPYQIIDAAIKKRRTALNEVVKRLKETQSPL